MSHQSNRNKYPKKYKLNNKPYFQREKSTIILKINPKEKEQDKKNKRKHSINALPATKKLECWAISVNIALTYFANFTAFHNSINVE